MEFEDVRRWRYRLAWWLLKLSLRIDNDAFNNLR